MVDIPGLQTNVLVGHLAGPYYVETGRSAHRGDRRWISQGQVGVTPAGSPVYRSFKGKPQIALIHLDPNMIHSIAADVFRRDPARVHLVPKLAETDETASRLIRLLLREAEQPWMTGSDLVIDDLSRALAIHTLRFHSNLSTQAPEARAQLTPARMRRVVDYMEANLDQPLSVAGLASVGELSASHFGRAFRDATGRSPHRFLTVLRIARARELLTTTKLPITEIGLRCGFAHPSHFATTFRRTTGLTPRDWRSLAE